jgi:hypothetical protein
MALKKFNAHVGRAAITAGRRHDNGLAYDRST